MNKQVSRIDPSVALHLRAFIELPPDGRAIVEALWLWDWVEGFKEGLPIPDLSKISGVSERQAKRIVKELREHKDQNGNAEPWVITHRPFGGNTCYKLCIPVMTWPEAKQVLAERLGLANWAMVARMRGLGGPLFVPQGPESGATVAPPNIKISSSTTQPQDTTSPKAIGGKHPDQDGFWEKAKASFSLKNSGAELGWPRDAKGFNKNLTAELECHGGIELARRWDNMVNDPWVSASLRNFILETDKWINRREKLTGGNNARAFHQPKTDWQPSGNKAPD